MFIPHSRPDLLGRRYAVDRRLNGRETFFLTVDRLERAPGSTPHRQRRVGAIREDVVPEGAVVPGADLAVVPDVDFIHGHNEAAALRQAVAFDHHAGAGPAEEVEDAA